FICIARAWLIPVFPFLNFPLERKTLMVDACNSLEFNLDLNKSTFLLVEDAPHREPLYEEKHGRPADLQRSRKSAADPGCPVRPARRKADHPGGGRQFTGRDGQARGRPGSE